ncbi:hypothetical protein [Cellulosilyticum sp. I15G10I2]|uniref:hypothetical protein n=1 Tax=Cellulosilyticum sp. I15G10I2 TaxID=1892843 RepID=UPI00085CDA23|nr:hypothetical protein [Cellulosilyticum sp. I15G10I2]
MEKDSKRYWLGAGGVLLAAICSMQLPHTNKSIFEFIIPTIKPSPNSRIYVNGLLAIIILVWSYNEIVKSNYFKSSRVVIFLVMFFIIVPNIFQWINAIKAPYYALSRGLKSIELIDSKYDLHYDKSNSIKLELKLKNYSSNVKKLKVALVLPEIMSSVISESKLILPTEYYIHPQESKIIIDQLKFTYVDEDSENDLFNISYWYDNYQIILFNDNDELVIKQGKD